MTNIFPERLFRKPKGAIKPKLEPLSEILINQEMGRTGDLLAPAINSDLTVPFFKTLYYKIAQNPPENITLEIKGQPRSGKSTVAIFIYVWLCEMTGFKPTVKNILGSQNELVHRLKDAKYGESFIVDEQTPETYGEGVVTEASQLSKNLDICAKKCNNLIFIYPPRFSVRGAPYGLEMFGKDSQNMYNRCFVYDLTHRNFGITQFPLGYVIIPKYIDGAYVSLPPERWSEVRIKNFRDKKYDFCSKLEEEYETVKDRRIEEVRKLSTSNRNKMKEDFAGKLADDADYLMLKNRGLRVAYVQMRINKGDFMDVAKTEVESIVDMADVISKIGRDEN